ncbi:hypothetical protein KUTeg_012885 [Tegillarca granosa]|uniref:F-box domain-containing protein n=1 Tax=Tegillarca granosa TaxID=220873 RepID=A0ABQ9EUI7_TEGGR|nr:hypothetical protein KUTeg_012885 [Tegillarca granosa]
MATNRRLAIKSVLEGDDSDYKEGNIRLLALPDEILENVLSFLNFDEASEARLVNSVSTVLNQGFSRVDKLHAQIQKNVKSQLPRRESERRNHPLARHVDILSAIETRLSLLGMTYMRYIDMGLCCFIPGKVLDELFRILSTLQKTKEPPRAHEFLQELRDISSMAMEHFEEKIAPALKAKMPAVTLPFPFDSPHSPEPQPGTSSQLMSPVLSPNTRARGPGIRHEIAHVRLQNQIRSHSALIQQSKKDVVDCRNKLIEQRKKSSEQEKKIQAQNKLITEQGEIISEQEKKINDLSKKY